jgi:hypothetical protein
MRMEQASMDDLVDMFIKLAKNAKIPESTVIIVGSLSHLSRVGTHGYAISSVNARRRLTGTFKGVKVFPFAPPPPFEGCNNPEPPRFLYLVWQYPRLPPYWNKKIHCGHDHGGWGGGEGATHYDSPVLLPFDLESYDRKYVTSPGRPGIPATVPSRSQADEKKFLDILIRDHNENLLAGVDPDPNMLRSAKRPQMYPAFRSGTTKTVTFVDGSNAKNLSAAAANLSIDSYKLAICGWKIAKTLKNWFRNWKN